jgi:uncharacterized protein YciI
VKSHAGQELTKFSIQTHWFMNRLLTMLFLLVSVTLFAQEKQYTFIFLNKKPDAEKISKEESDKIMKGHMDNINRLAQEGKLIAAGPFEGGGGIFVFNTKSIEEANQWLSTDPGVQAKRWNLDVLPFHVRTGGVCVAKEPYEMVTYNLVRYKAAVSKTTAQDFPEIIRKHDEYLKGIKQKEHVLIEGTFGDHEGGVMIVNGDLPEDLTGQDPGVQEGLIECEIKKLWIAKGAFCEN